MKPHPLVFLLVEPLTNQVAITPAYKKTLLNHSSSKKCILKPNKTVFIVTCVCLSVSVYDIVKHYYIIPTEFSHTYQSRSKVGLTQTNCLQVSLNPVTLLQLNLKMEKYIEVKYIAICSFCFYPH